MLAADSFFSPAVLAWLVFFLFVALPWFLMVGYVYNDAQKRNMPSPELWALGTFALGPIALIAYLIDRPTSKRIDCPYCGSHILDTDAVCPFCNRRLTESKPVDADEDGWSDN